MFRTVRNISCFLLLAIVPLGASPLRYAIEVNHSTIGFSIPIFGGLSRVSGKFTDVEVEIIHDEENVEASKVTAVLQVSGISTGIEMRDKDLQNPIFFEAEKHPEIRFESKRIQRKEDGNYEAIGDFTMKGVTKEVTMPFELKVHKFENGRQILGVKMRTQLNRIDFGVGAGWKHTSMDNFLGETIAVEIDLWTRSGKPLE